MYRNEQGALISFLLYFTLPSYTYHTSLGSQVQGVVAGEGIFYSGRVQA